jgi:hypothetical protein
MTSCCIGRVIIIGLNHIKVRAQYLLNFEERRSTSNSSWEKILKDLAFHNFNLPVLCTSFPLLALSKMTTNNTLILVGGTGGLGMKIAKGLATAEGFDAKKAIVRDLAKGKELEEMGWTLVPVADYMDATALEAAFVGAKTVVSTFGGADQIALEKATVAAAKKAGASLFVPSQFGVDWRRWPNQHPILASKQQVLDAAKEADLPALNVFVGYFAVSDKNV